MKITDQMVATAYEFAREVYRKTMGKSIAIDKLTTKTGMNSTSAENYIRNLQHMLDGEEYHRTLNFHATCYFLANIRTDFGEVKLSKALSALKKHIDYYDSMQHGRQPKLRKLLKEYLSSIHADTNHPEELGIDETLFEGAKRQVTVNAFERNAKARQQCITRYGYKCSVCEFDFEKVYGEVGREFIHVHHLVELSTIGKKYRIDPVKDLRPVCPNCHAMLHKGKPNAFSIDELRDRLKKRLP